MRSSTTDKLSFSIFKQGNNMSAIYHDNKRFSSFKSLAICAALLTSIPVFVQAQDSTNNETGLIDKTTKVVINGVQIVTTKSAEIWEETKQSGSEAKQSVDQQATAAGKYTREKSTQAWDATKQGANVITEKSGELWDSTKTTSKTVTNYTVDKSSDAWNATKHGADVAADYTVDTYTKVKKSLADGDSSTISVEDKSVE